MFRLPNDATDLTPWNHWRLPAIVETVPRSDEGPVLVAVEYRVAPADRHAFLEAMHRYGRVRRRDGASRWGIFRDLERADVYVETFVVNSWAEHLRQHERLTRADASGTRSSPRHRHWLVVSSLKA